MKHFLKIFGANAKESAIFFKLLELGAQPVSIIAKHMGLPRSSMYLILDRLKQLSLIEEFAKSGIKYVKCIPVKNLKDILKSKEKTLQQGISLLEEQLPQLERLENTLSITPKVSFFERKDAVIKMYQKILKEKEFYSLFHPQMVKKIIPQYFYLIPEELKQNKGNAKELLVYCNEALEYKNKYESPKHQIKILSPEIIFYSDTIIAKDVIYMVSYGEMDVSAVEIINKSLADTQRKMFENLWSKN